MRICYIDDNEEYLNSFKDNFTFMQYPNEYIGSDDVADIVMLDIEFGSEGNGLDYLDCITKKSGYTQIVIVTAYTEKYIEDIFMQKENVAGFLKKPIDRETMLRVFAKAEMLIRNKKAEVTVRTAQKSIRHRESWMTLSSSFRRFLSDVTRAILLISIKSKASRAIIFL